MMHSLYHEYLTFLYQRTCEPSIFEAVNTIIWAAPRVGEVKELGLVCSKDVQRYRIYL